MKKFILKQWYPSLYEDIEEGIEVEYKDGWIYYVNTRGNKTCVEFDPNEFIFTDFWELIEDEKPKPLFITEDGVEVYVDDFVVFVNSKLEKSTWRASIINNGWDFSKVKAFSRKSNADEYIWKNKRVFSYEDMMKAKHSIILADEDIEKAAKKRSNQ